MTAGSDPETGSIRSVPPRTRSGRILIVDDEANARAALAELLREEGYAVETAADAFKALPKLEEFEPELLLTDLKMPGMDGISLMRKAQQADPQVAVIVMTAFGAIDTAVSAMREGAADYLTKPLNLEELTISVERTLERRRLQGEASQLRQRLSERDRIENIVGSSPPMLKIFETVLQVAPSRASVLITGESGTGKERSRARGRGLSWRRDSSDGPARASHQGGRSAAMTLYRRFLARRSRRSSAMSS